MIKNSILHFVLLSLEKSLVAWHNVQYWGIFALLFAFIFTTEVNETYHHE